MHPAPDSVTATDDASTADAGAAATPTPVGVSRSDRARALVPWAVVLLAPLIGLVALRASPMNAINYPDPWFYSGYGWSFRHHIDVFGWFYYAIRFPASLPIGWSADALGPVAGYLVLHYAIVTATSAALFACLRRVMSTAIACAAVVLLCASPFYLRMVTWDYTTFVELPAMIAAIALWYLGVGGTPRAQLLTAAGTGVAIACAVFANPLGTMVVPTLAFVEAVAVLRVGRAASLELLRRAAVAFAAGAVVALAGWMTYRAKVGPIPLYQMIKPAIDFQKQGSLGDFLVPAGEWLTHEPRIWAPVLVVIALPIVWGRALLQTTVVARLAQVAVVFTVLVWAVRKANSAAIVETWWAYNLTAITIGFGLPALVYGLQQRERRAAPLLGAVIAATLVTAFAVRSDRLWWLARYEDLRSHTAVLVVVLAVAVAGVVAARLTRSTAVGAVALAVFAAILSAVSLTPAKIIGIEQTGEFSPFGGRAEIGAYEAAYRMLNLFDKTDAVDSRTLMWTSSTGLASMAWADLPHQGGALDQPSAAVPAPKLTPPQLALLELPTTRRVLFLTEDDALVPKALPALRRHGFPAAVTERQGSWADGDLHYQLIDLRKGA